MSAVRPFANDFLNAFNMAEKEISTHEEWLLREYSKLMHREASILKKEMILNRKEEQTKKRDGKMRIERKERKKWRERKKEKGEEK